MTDKEVPQRSEVPEQYTWNRQSLFASDGDWEAEFARFSDSLDDFGGFHGHLGESPAMLADALKAREELIRRAGRILVYASLSHSVDTTDQAAARAADRARGLAARVSATVSFVEPEVLALGEGTVRQWLRDEPRLAIYAHWVDDLFRKQAHVRSAEVEELMGMLNDPFSGVSATSRMLRDADFQFAPARSSDGREIPLTQSNWMRLLADGDREVRRTAWENYLDRHLDYKHTLAANLSTSIKQNVFHMRARRHDSTLGAALFEHNIPVEVFHSLIDTFRQNLPTWHRYWSIRKRALGVDALHPYDIWAPLTSERSEIPYEQAVDWICEGLAPLGDDYVQVMRRGCLEERWVDVYPNRGKGGGAFSSGRPSTHPFIVMSYTDTILSLSTLAHELGHSMHSYLTWQNQPVVYSRYPLFLAEVASNFHQAMVRGYLLELADDVDFQISVIEEAMSNFHRYFFIMPTLARFELETHQRVEQGKGLTADDMIDLMVDLFAEGYGSHMAFDRERVGIVWATFGHLYVDYYVYQYATGISGANALARAILEEEPGAAERYLSFLRAGGSMYALDALRMAGVDLSTPEAVEVTFAVLSGMVDRLEALVGEAQTRAAVSA